MRSSQARVIIGVVFDSREDVTVAVTYVAATCAPSLASAFVGARPFGAVALVLVDQRDVARLVDQGISPHGGHDAGDHVDFADAARRGVFHVAVLHVAQIRGVRCRGREGRCGERGKQYGQGSLRQAP